MFLMGLLLHVKVLIIYSKSVVLVLGDHDGNWVLFIASLYHLSFWFIDFFLLWQIFLVIFREEVIELELCDHGMSSDL